MTEWLSASLSDAHDLTGFDCGNDELDGWLRNQALRAQRANTARTYVWTSRENAHVVAYYSIAPTQILRDSLSGSQAGGYSTVPAYLLARLALDHSLPGQGLGSELLVDALGTIVRAAKLSGGRLVVVDAIDDAAAAFYRHHDFQPVKGNPRRLVMKVATAQHALDVTGIRVTPDRNTQLVSIVLEFPDGTTKPVVASAVETDRIAHRLQELANAARGEDFRIDFAEVLREVLGRDPWSG
jgi:predicted N-acetyltransferase YhbS